MAVSFHAEATEIAAKLRKEHIRALYHFTSIENLPCIREMGALCSKHILDAAGRWPVAEPGGNALSHNLDRCNNNWDRISLNFTPHTPMVYNKKPSSHLCFLEIDPVVATWDGVLFTNTNAASTGNQQRAPGLAGLDLVDFNAVRSRPRPWDREGWVRPVQAEVLVPKCIPLNYVTRIRFVSDASRDEAERLWGPSSHPQFEAYPLSFSDNPSAVSLTFPFLKTILLTDQHVNASSLGRARTPNYRLRRSTCDRATLIAEVHAVAGLKAQITWKPIGATQTEEFEKTEDYWHWPSLSLSRLPDGPCSVDYRLGCVRWATLPFEVVA